MQGAATAQKEFDNDDLATNDCYKYAALRNILYRKGKTMEVMVSYEPAYTMMSEWFKQLLQRVRARITRAFSLQALSSQQIFTHLVSTFRTAEELCLKLLFSLINVKRSYTRHRSY